MGFSILIVDDSRLFLEAASALLKREGLDVLDVASTTAHARGRVKQLRPDVVLVDINLGAESGFELARRLSEDDQGRGSTVILMSTREEADFGNLVAESPAVGFMTKTKVSADAIRLIRDGGRR